MKKKNMMIRCLCIIVIVSSISLNLYFLTKKESDSVVLRINNESVLRENEMREIIIDKYKKSTLQSLANSNIIRLEALKNTINSPNKNELMYIKNNFPDIVSETSSDAQLTEVYFVYKLYDILDDVSKVITNFYEKNFNTDPILYELVTVTGKDHQILMDILNDLEKDQNTAAIEKKYNISIEEFFKPTLDDIKEKGNQSKGEYYHFMLDNGDMTLVYVKNKLELKDNQELFKIFYFNSHYLEIRAEILNNIKSNYSVSYE